jgi:GTPase SAR1 family protein
MIKKEAEQKGKTIPSLVLVGNKADMPDKRKVQSSQAQECATEWGAGYVETSARTGYNVDKAFEDLVRLIRRRTDTGPEKKSAGKRVCVLI